MSLCLLSGGCGGTNAPIIPEATSETENNDSTTQNSSAWVGTWSSTVTVDSGGKSESADVTFSLEQKSSSANGTAILSAASGDEAVLTTVLYLASPIVKSEDVTVVADDSSASDFTVKTADGSFSLSASSTSKAITLKDFAVAGYKLTGTVGKASDKSMSDLGSSQSNIASKLAGNWAIEGKSSSAYSGYIIFDGSTMFLSAFLASGDSYTYPVIDKASNISFDKLAGGFYKVNGLSAEGANITVYDDNAILRLTNYLVRPIGSTTDYKLNPALKLQKFAPTAITMTSSDFVGTWTVKADYSSSSSVGSTLIVKASGNGFSATLQEDSFTLASPVKLGTNVFSMSGDGDQFIFFMNTKTAGRIFIDATASDGNSSVTYAVLANIEKTSNSTGDTPSTETPTTDTPTTEQPTTDTPSTETDTPSTDTPSTDEQSTDTDKQTTDTPDTPSTETPTTDTPTTEQPTTDTPSTDTQDNEGIETPGADLDGIETPGAEL